VQGGGDPRLVPAERLDLVQAVAVEHDQVAGLGQQHHARGGELGVGGDVAAFVVGLPQPQAASGRWRLQVEHE
jgi:hypothetical protein